MVALAGRSARRQRIKYPYGSDDSSVRIERMDVAMRWEDMREGGVGYSSVYLAGLLARSLARSLARAVGGEKGEGWSRMAGWYFLSSFVERRALLLLLPSPLCPLNRYRFRSPPSDHLPGLALTLFSDRRCRRTPR